MYLKATGGQRVLACLIDFILIFILYFICAQILNSVIDVPEIPAQMNDVLKTGDYEQLSAYFQSAEYEAYSDAYFDCGIVPAVIISLLAIIFIYLVLIPTFWKKQTIGRLAMKINVKLETQDSGSFGTYFLREFVGVLLIGLLNCCCFIPLIINIVFICKGLPTIHDRIAQTDMFSTVNKYAEFEESDTSSKEENTVTFIDAE